MREQRRCKRLRPCERSDCTDLTAHRPSRRPLARKQGTKDTLTNGLPTKANFTGSIRYLLTTKVEINSDFRSLEELMIVINAKSVGFSQCWPVKARLPTSFYLTLLT
jgi:hypothetical protein